MWHSMPDRGWAGTMTVTSRLVPRQMCFMKPLYSFGCENKVPLCLGLGKCPTVMFHTTQLLGIYHLQYILEGDVQSPQNGTLNYHPPAKVVTSSPLQLQFRGNTAHFQTHQFCCIHGQRISCKAVVLKTGSRKKMHAVNSRTTPFLHHGFECFPYQITGWWLTI